MKKIIGFLGGNFVLSVNDLFCGAGGMGLGFKNAGFEIVGSCDFDKFAVKSYAANVSDTVVEADITQMKWNDIPKADVWTFGFPCQDISIAGKQEGMIKGKTRSGLFYEVMRLLEETRENDPSRLPKIILAENVKEVRKYLDEIENEYHKQGYKLYYELFNTKYWDIPQNRERYFMVGVLEDIKEEFIFPTEKKEVTKCLADILVDEDTVDESFYRDHMPMTPMNKMDTDIKVVGNTSKTGFRKLDVHHISGISPTLLARDYKDATQVMVNGRVRKLVPREYARLQGFPDSYEFVVSNTQLYKQFGNAVTVNVAEAIAKAIKEFLIKVR